MSQGPTWMHAFLILAMSNLGVALGRLYDHFIWPKIAPRKP